MYALRAFLTMIVALWSVTSEAQLQYPLAIAVGENDTAYVADRNLPGVWQIKDGKAEIYYQGSKTFRTPLNAVRCVTIDEKGRLLAGDSSTRDIYRFDADKQPVALTEGRIGIPMAIAVGKEGELFVADLELHRLWKVPALGGEPVEYAVVAAPRGLAIDSEQRLWVVSHGKDQIVRINPDQSTDVIVKGRPFDFPHQIVLEGEGGAFVTDGYAQAVWKVNADGSTAKLHTGEPFANPVGLAISSERLYIADPRQKSIYTMKADGKPSLLFPANP